MMGGLDGSTLHIPAFQNMAPLLDNAFESAQYSDDMITQMQLANELLGINPQDIVRPDQQHQSMFQHNEDTQRPSPSADDNSRCKVKAERLDEVDDEFGHLSCEPGQAPVQPAAAASNQFTELRSANPPQTPAAPAKNDASFQSSFLNFLGGAKQETLSSVTNSAVTAKPQLPKYIPPSSPKKYNRKKAAIDKTQSNTQTAAHIPSNIAPVPVVGNRGAVVATQPSPMAAIGSHASSPLKAKSRVTDSPSKKKRKSSSKRADASMTSAATSDDVSHASYAPVARNDFSCYPSSWN